MFQSVYSTLFGSQELVPVTPSPTPVPPTKYTLAGHHKVGFDDIQYVLRHPSPTTLMINTLPLSDQDNLIHATLPHHQEEPRINDILTDYHKTPNHYTFILYGKNSADDTVDKKYKQLTQLGFTQVFIYYGGMFEWMILQDVYGSEHFPTTNPDIKDPLRYMARRKLKY